MTTEERKSYENGIWLCRTHAALIDRDEKYFTIKMLKDWKEQAEKDSGEEIIGITSSIASCKLKVKLFYKDLEESRRWIALMKMQRGVRFDITNFPVQNNWEHNVEELVSLIGADIATELIRILREIEEMKGGMMKENERIGIKRVADNGTISYCRRCDLFLERMDNWLTDEFMEALEAFVEI